MNRRWSIIPWISLSFLLLGMLLCFCSAFDCEIVLARHFFSSIAIAGVVLFLVLQRKGKFAFLFTSAGILGVIVFALFKMEQLHQDFLSIVYYMNEKSMAYNGTSIIDFEGVQGEVDNNLLLRIIGILLAVFISFFAFRLHSRYYGFLPVWLIPMVGLAVGAAPGEKAVIVTFIGVVLAFTWISYQEKGGRYSFVQKRITGRKNGVFVYVILLAVIAVGLLGARIFETGTKERILSHSEEYLKRQHKMERSVARTAEKMAQLITGRVGIDSDGRLSNEEPYYTNQVVMELTASVKPTEPFYLRGFVGGEYQNGRWSPCETKELRKIVVDEMGEENINLAAFHYAEWYYEEYPLEEEWKGAVQLKIEYKGNGKRSKYAYVPYYSNIAGILGEDEGDCVSLDGENGLVREQDVYYLTCYNFGEEICRAVAVAQKQDCLNLSDVQKQAYYKYINLHYAVLPDKSLSQLKSLAKAYRYGTQNPILVAQTVQSVLKQTATYSKDLEPVPEGKDYVEYFLYQQKKGYCEHFATAGTLLVRAKGIPARYVSGYKVSSDSFIQNGDGTYTAKVLDSDAHAWTEVYAGDGNGWFPIEMTPGADETSQRQSTTIGMNQVTPVPEQEEAVTESPQAKKPGQTIEPTQTPKAATEKPVETSEPGKEEEDKDNGTKGIRLYGFYLLAALCIIVLAGVAIGRIIYPRLQIRKYDRELMKVDGDYNAFVCIRTEKLLYFMKHCGIRGLDGLWENQWLEKLTMLCGERFDAGTWGKIKEIIQKAEYARDSVTAEEFEFYCTMVKEVEQALLGRQGRIRKGHLWFLGWKS